MSDQEINLAVIERAASGDVAAFEVIYQAYSGFVFHVALRVCRGRDEAEEITQEVFMTVYRKLGSFRGQSSLKTWVYRVTVNTALNYLKRESRHRDTVPADEQVLTAVAHPAVVSQMSEQEYQTTLVDRLLAGLTPEQRMCVVLRNMEGLSYEQIAQALKINLNAVRSRLKRAREKMIAMRGEVMGYEM